MYQFESKASGNLVKFKELIGEAGELSKAKAITVFTVGIHGNEPTGLEAFVRVLEFIDANNIKVCGYFCAIAGNPEALSKSERYIDADLNRNWNDETVKNSEGNNEGEQKQRIWERIIFLREKAEEKNVGFYHFDLHTTSSESVPFAIINETLESNIEISKNLPCYKIVGMHPYQNSTMTDYFNSKGIASYLFESGQHDSPISIDAHEAFIWINLVETGIVEKNEIKDKYHDSFLSLEKFVMSSHEYFEVCYCHRIRENEIFEMNPGYTNLFEVKEGEYLADSNGEKILADRNANILMPLYQKQGDDGFFLVCHCIPPYKNKE